MQSCPVPVMPRSCRVPLDFPRELELAQALKILLQDRSLALQLKLVGRMLILAAPAALEVRTQCLDPFRRGLKNPLHRGPGKSGFLFSQCGGNLFSGQSERNENSFPASLLVGGQAR